MMLTGIGSLTSDIAAAIAQMEGAGTRNNNPGNLMALPNYTYPGQVGVDSRGFAVFDSMASGQAQLGRQIDLNISRGLSTQQFFCGAPGVYAGYAPNAGGNDCQGYAAFVAGQLGIDPSIPLNQADTGTPTGWTGRTTRQGRWTRGCSRDRVRLSCWRAPRCWWAPGSSREIDFSLPAF